MNPESMPGGACSRLRDEGGFTVAELLVASFIGLVVLAITFGAMSVQGRSASYQAGLADAQMTGMGAGEILMQDLRMAGYGMLGVPPEANVPPLSMVTSAGILTVTMRGAYSNTVTTLASGAAVGASTIAATAGAFQPNNLVLIDSGVNAEVRTIASASGGGPITIGLGQALSHSYPPGPSVTQLEVVVWTLQNGLLRRNGAVVGESVGTFGLQFVDQNGTTGATVPDSLRAVLLNLVANQPNPLPDQAHPARSTVATEANLRNLAFRFTLN